MTHWKKTGLLLATLILAACHHTNSLKTKPSKDVASFLMNASANAEKRLTFVIQQDSYGYGYLECMEGKISPEIKCPELYQAMIQFSKEGHYPAFKNITLADLTEPSMFEKIAEDYIEIAITTSPHFVSKN